MDNAGKGTTSEDEPGFVAGVGRVVTITETPGLSHDGIQDADKVV